MNETIKLTLIKSLIINSVKNETFFRGQVVKAADGKLITEAYHEQAGDEAYQEKMLARGLATNLADLLTHLSDYLSTSGQSSGDNIIDYDEEGDNIIISLVVSDRFNKGYTDPLAKLSAKYIEEAMLMDWWKPINEKQSALYAQFVERDLAAIKRCFNKTAPAAPVVPYTRKLEVTGSAVCLEPGDEATVTYAVDADAIDDIEAMVEDESIARVGRTKEGFTLKGNHRGHTWAKLYSRHDPDVSRTIHIYVNDHS